MKKEEILYNIGDKVKPAKLQMLTWGYLGVGEIVSIKKRDDNDGHNYKIKWSDNSMQVFWHGYIELVERSITTKDLLFKLDLIEKKWKSCK